MLSKLQKIWAWIFGAMFIVPEILWGNITKSLHFSFLPIYRSVQLFTDNPILAFAVIIMETFGIIGIIYLLNRGGFLIPLIVKYISNIVLGIILLLLLLSLCLTFVVTQISF